MKRLPRLLFCLALLIVAGSALANPYGYAYFRTVTIDHTKVGVAGYAAYRSVTVDHTKVQGSSSYAYNRSITIDHNKVGTVNNTDQSNFPVLISGTFNGSGGTFDVRTAANGGPIQNTTTLNGTTVPADLIFTSDAACTTKLNWEIVNYTAASGLMEAWVQVPTVSHTVDTVIYACYDNSAVTTYQGSATSTWDANYLGVWHTNGDPAGSAPQELDSTTHGKNLSVQCCGTPALVAGKIGNGVDTTGDQGFIANASSFSTTLTSSAWIKTTSTTLPGWMGQFDGSGLGAGFGFVENGSNNGYLRLTVSAGLNGGNNQTTYDASSGKVNDGSWHYAVFTYVSGTGFVMYVDGNSVGTFGSGYSGSLNNGATFYFAHNYVGGYQWNGASDEARLSNVARSADWINTEYKNQNSPSTFTTIGSQGTPPLTNFPVLVANTYSYLATAANSGQIQNTVTLNGVTVPADLIFTSDAACTTKLNWEVASYNAASGAIEVWVNIPILSTTTDTAFYMCYNNSAVSTYQGGATSTWDSSFQAVYHLNNNAGNTTVTESTSNANTGTNTTNTSTTTTAGQITNGFNYAGNYGTVGSHIAALDGVGSATISAWINPNSLAQSKYFVSQADNSFSSYWEFGTDNTYINDLALQVNGGSCSTNTHPLSSGSWQYVTFVLTGGNSYGSRCKIYYNGSSITPGFDGLNSVLPSNTYAIALAENKDALAASKFDGKLDEVRVSTTARSAGWIATEYNNQSLPDKAHGAGGFYTMGSETSLGVDETNFPVLVFCSACTYLKTGANSGQIQKTATLNGQTVPVDLIFTSDAAGQTLLNWEVASYNAATGDTEVWVKIPTLSHTADTVIYMWYNNANIAATYLGSATSVWDSNYKGVWHLPNGTTLAAKDSTSNGRNGTLENSPPATTGKIDGAASLNGTSQWIDTGVPMSDFVTTTDGTFEGWAYLTGAAQGSDTDVSGSPIFQDANEGDNTYGWIGFGASSEGVWYGSINNNVKVTAPYTLNVWTHVVYTFTGGTSTLYINGSSVSSTAVGAPVLAGNAALGLSFNDNHFPGYLDEVRASNVARPVDWITTEYKNQNSPSTFETIGSQVVAHTHAKGLFE